MPTQFWAFSRMRSMKFFLFVLYLLVFTSTSFAKMVKTPRYIVKYKDGRAKSIKTHFSKVSVGTRESDVEYVEEDLLLKPMTSDIYWNDQWALRQYPGIDIQSIWSKGYSGDGVVIAVIDTGILYHEDLAGKILPGFDFISDPQIAADGGGRDNDPTDVGDAIDSSSSCYYGSTTQSSWHGTHVAGIAAANIDDGVGIAGVSDARILPLRVLGKCGGLTSDIADAIRWAAGGHVGELPINPTPAKVINLSLGGFGSCPRYMQESIDYARSQGVAVVVAAGNSGEDLSYYQTTPANCRGVVVVGSHNRYGEVSSFSNYGEMVDIYAPGENIISLSDFGANQSEGDAYKSHSGTSMSAPMVSGMISLLYGANSSLYPDQIEEILESTARKLETNSILLVDLKMAIDLAISTQGDSSYRHIEAFSMYYPYEPAPTFMNANDDEGGLCGNIQEAKGSGPKGPLSMIFLTFLFVLGIEVLAKKQSGHR